MEFFLLGGTIVEKFNTDGYEDTLKAAEEGEDFQLASFDPKMDTAASLLAEVLGQDDFISLNKKQYIAFLKIQTK